MNFFPKLLHFTFALTVQRILFFIRKQNWVLQKRGSCATNKQINLLCGWDVGD
jgi:hypothetical protein